jgi:hypothetical protein
VNCCALQKNHLCSGMQALAASGHCRCRLQRAQLLPAAWPVPWKMQGALGSCNGGNRYLFLRECRHAGYRRQRHVLFF